MRTLLVALVIVLAQYGQPQQPSWAPMPPPVAGPGQGIQAVPVPSVPTYTPPPAFQPYTPPPPPSTYQPYGQPSPTPGYNPQPYGTPPSR